MARWSALIFALLYFNVYTEAQNIKSIGYHYYMTPETANLGLEKLPEAIAAEPKQWVYTDWPDLSQMDVFRDE